MSVELQRVENDRLAQREREVELRLSQAEMLQKLKPQLEKLKPQLEILRTYEESRISLYRNLGVAFLFGLPLFGWIISDKLWEWADQLEKRTKEMSRIDHWIRSTAER